MPLDTDWAQNWIVMVSNTQKEPPWRLQEYVGHGINSLTNQFKRIMQDVEGSCSRRRKDQTIDKASCKNFKWSKVPTRKAV